MVEYASVRMVVIGLTPLIYQQSVNNATGMLINSLIRHKTNSTLSNKVTEGVQHSNCFSS